ncbi:FAD-dependent protein, partial [Oceanivirga salmonicida]|uniref:FAD-dependent protein n=1 Tax=Oceanivirga salmonicida TaxID=1769291 RepID=UPI000AEFB110
MIRITGIKVPIKHTKDDILKKIKEILKTSDEIKSFKISNKSIDARKKSNILIVYSVDIEIKNEDKYINDNNIKKIEEMVYDIPDLSNYTGKRPVVIGSGPAGIFAALVLAKANLKPIIIERGRDVDKRVTDVYKFFETCKLDTNSNVQFGEGGAGTFSDGKLTTNTHNKRIKVVIDELIKAGADPSISYISKPHIGTDILIDLVKKIRETIISLGGEYRFESKLIDFTEEKKILKNLKIKEINGKIYELETDNCILAIGHSARDTFKMLKEKKLYMTKKIFAVGFRIEHKQSFINEAQYGSNNLNLPPAEYKINTRTTDGRGVYTFCMCPG